MIAVHEATVSPVFPCTTAAAVCSALVARARARVDWRRAARIAAGMCLLFDQT